MIHILTKKSDSVILSGAKRNEESNLYPSLTLRKTTLNIIFRKQNQFKAM